jgi:GxxExxY protein
MPVHCEIAFPRLSDDEMRQLDYAVTGHAFATHNDLGRLCDESIYQHDFVRRLRNAGIEATIEVPVTLSFRNFTTPLALDLAVERKVIYELKTVASLNRSHEAQLLRYLFLTNSTHGKLVNFRGKSVESRFV